MDALKKFKSNQIDKNQGFLRTFESLNQKENSFHINFGEMTALAMTPVGKAMGMG